MEILIDSTGQYVAKDSILRNSIKYKHYYLQTLLVIMIRTLSNILRNTIILKTLRKKMKFSEILVYQTSTCINNFYRYLCIIFYFSLPSMLVCIWLLFFNPRGFSTSESDCSPFSGLVVSSLVRGWVWKSGFSVLKLTWYH